MEKIKVFGELTTKTFVAFGEDNKEIKFIDTIDIKVRPSLGVTTCDIKFHHPAGITIAPQPYEIIELILLNKGFKK